jgi:cytochrome P450
MSAAIFVGPEISRDPEWQKLTSTYTMNAFMAIRALRAWPEFMRPFVHWFLPECVKCREHVRLARSMLQSVLDKRARAREAALAEGRTPEKYEDTIAWMEEAAAGRPFDAVAAQLAFAMSAMHTTSELLKQTVLDICKNPELIQSIRDEVDAAISESGWTTAGLFKMQLLDSVVKESQRLKPGSLGELIASHIRTFF